MAATHNHQHCVEDALTRAQRLCQQRGARLTPLRQRVLELVWGSHNPVGAYDLLALLQKEQKAAPPTVYRALDFLQAMGLVHRIASRNAFIGCPDPGDGHRAQFLICRNCGEASELPSDGVERAIGKEAQNLGFKVEQMTVEIEGLCRRCAA